MVTVLPQDSMATDAGAAAQPKVHCRLVSPASAGSSRLLAQHCPESQLSWFVLTGHGEASGFATQLSFSSLRQSRHPRPPSSDSFVELFSTEFENGKPLILWLRAAVFLPKFALIGRLQHALFLPSFQRFSTAGSQSSPAHRCWLPCKSILEAGVQDQSPQAPR